MVRLLIVITISIMGRIKGIYNIPFADENYGFKTRIKKLHVLECENIGLEYSALEILGFWFFNLSLNQTCWIT